jgi:hypothetical protein
MKTKINLNQIIDTATKVDANEFARYLDDNKINWTILDCNLMDFNDEYFNITLDDYNDKNIFFVDGQYQS